MKHALQKSTKVDVQLHLQGKFHAELCAVRNTEPRCQHVPQPLPVLHPAAGLAGPGGADT